MVLISNVIVQHVRHLKACIHNKNYMLINVRHILILYF